METREFRFVKNMLWPVKTSVVVGPDGITRKDVTTRWPEITDFRYTVTSINRAMNYQIAWQDGNGKGHSLNYIVTVVGSRRKKQLCRDLYAMLREGFNNHHIAPQAKELDARIEGGESVPLGPVTVESDSLVVDQGRRGTQTIANADVRLTARHSGGFHVGSADDEKRTTYVPLASAESRYLLAVLETRFPDQALDLN